MKDYPYNILKEDKRAYEIMLLRDQCGSTFTDIAKKYAISVTTVSQSYNKTKIRQIRLYVNHIAVVLGHKDASQISEIFNKGFDCYQGWTYTSGYLEQKYKHILDEYRKGEPGMPVKFIKGIPPFKSRLNKNTIARVVKMREEQKTTYNAIAKKLGITPAKARQVYDSFYHKQVLVMLKELQNQAESHKEEMAMRDYYFQNYRTPKQRYDALTNK